MVGGGQIEIEIMIEMLVRPGWLCERVGVGLL